jgi:hypothetical protein
MASVSEDQVAWQLGHYVTDKATTVPHRIKALDDGTYISAYDTVSKVMNIRRGNPVALGLKPETVTPFARELYNFIVRVPPEDLARKLNSMRLETFATDSSRLADFGRHLQMSSPITEQGMDTLVAQFVHREIQAHYPIPANSSESLQRIGRDYSKIFNEDELNQVESYLMKKGKLLNTTQLAYLFGGLVHPSPMKLAEASHNLAEDYCQVHPEYMVNFDAGAIVIFQVLISFLIGFWPPLTAMVIGIVISAIGIGMCAFFATGWPIVLAIIIFAFGEMMASPKSQEYVGRIAPPQKVAMFMGYYFWTVALGNIFGGRLSGELYGSLARDMNRPDIMWIIFGVLGIVTAVILVGYDWLVIRRHEKAGKEHPMSRTMEN